MTTMEFNHMLISMENNMYRFALRLTSDKEKAKDLLQETYLKALIYKDKYTEFSNLKAWAFTIMKNTFINDYRRSYRENISVDNIKDSLYLYNFEESNPERPDSEYVCIEINKAIDALADEFKIPFRMHVDGFKYKTIAETLNLNIGTVKSRIFLTRKKLMKALHDYQ
jgi:RNA polymerase sigma-70 factor (ECF subfamily)